MEKISPELKAAIVALSADEKDKLLLRMLRLKPDLIKRLTYELLEEKETLDARTTKVQNSIDSYLVSTGGWFTPGNLLMTMRSCNASITEHTKVTKDKMGEVFLTLHLLLKAFELWRTKLGEFDRNRSITFAEYIVKRTAMVIDKAQKLDPLFQEDITEQINRILDYVHGYEHSSRLAENEKLPKFYVFGDVVKKKK
jgi:hypothetical protein